MRIILTALLLISSAAAQDFKSFVDSHKALIVADLAAKGADAYFTHRNIEGFTAHNRCYVDASGITQCPLTWYMRGREFDPIAAPFVKTTAGQVGYFSATFAGDVAASYLLQRMGHPKLARMALLTGVGYSASGATFSAHAYYTF